MQDTRNDQWNDHKRARTLTSVRRILGAAFLAVLLFACATSEVPPGPGPTDAGLAGADFVTSDGTHLFMRAWMPDTPPTAVVVALHGFNDHSRAFDKVAGAPGLGPYLAERGVAVYAYDQRGFGHSEHAGLWPGRDALIRDFRAFVDVVRGLHPGLKVFALGESMGGAVLLTAMANPTPPAVDGVILVAPAVWARSTMPFYYRPALWLGAHIAPGWRPTGEGLGRMASDNIPMLRENGRDPLFIKKTRLDAIYGLVGLMDEALLVPPRIKGPVLYMYGANDQIIPAVAAERAVDNFIGGRAGFRFAYYERGWHMMLRDLGGAVPLADIAAFIADPAGALPSGAETDAFAKLKAKKNEE